MHTRTIDHRGFRESDVPLLDRVQSTDILVRIQLIWPDRNPS
jgi:hypothetical protein